MTVIETSPKIVLGIGLQFLSENFRLRGFALLVGAAIPLTVFGRAVLAAAVGIGVILLLTSPLRSTAYRETLRRTASAMGYLIIAVVLAWSISAIDSLASLRSLEAAWRSGAFVFAAVLVWAALDADGELRNMAWRSLIVASLISIVFATLASTVFPELYWAFRLKGWLSTPLRVEFKAFSSLSVLLIPVLALAAARERGRWRWAALAAIVGSAFLVWDNYNRSAIAGVLGMLLVLPIAMFVRHGLKRAVIATAVSIFLVVATVIVWLVVSRSFLIEAAPSEDWMFPIWLVDFQRQTIWKHALHFFIEAPWFGIGPNTINFTPGADAPMPGDARLHIIPAHPHNWVVEILVETGSIGFGLLVAVIVSAAAFYLRAYRQQGDYGTLAALTIMAGYWVSGLFNFSYWSAWWQISFVFALALALAGRPRLNSP